MSRAQKKMSREKKKTLPKNIPIVKEDEYIKNNPIVDEGKLNDFFFAQPSMVMYASEDWESESDKENDNPELQILVGDVKEHVNVKYQPDNKDEMGTIEKTNMNFEIGGGLLCSYRKAEILVWVSILCPT